MGPIPSDNAGEDWYFLDFYIAYTPLSALVEWDHREPVSPTLTFPSLLLVAHFDVPSPDVSLSEVYKDVKVVLAALEKRLSVKSLISESAKPASVLDCLREHQFTLYATARWRPRNDLRQGSSFMVTSVSPCLTSRDPCLPP